MTPEPPEIGGTPFASPGQGQGFRGLPADGDSPSRFIRILHGFDIVPGTIVQEFGGRQLPELTIWSTVCNLTGRKCSDNTSDDPLWYELDLGALDFSTSRRAAFTTDGWLAPPRSDAARTAGIPTPPSSPTR